MEIDMDWTFANYTRNFISGALPDVNTIAHTHLFSSSKARAKLIISPYITRKIAYSYSWK